MTCVDGSPTGSRKKVARVWASAEVPKEMVLLPPNLSSAVKIVSLLVEVSGVQIKVPDAEAGTEAELKVSVPVPGMVTVAADRVILLILAGAPFFALKVTCVRACFMERDTFFVAFVQFKVPATRRSSLSLSWAGKV